MRVIAGLVIAVVCPCVYATEPAQRTLSFDERVKAQTSIERVYYSHQLGATKTFDDAVPKAVLEAKVHKYLDQTAALNALWKTAVTDYSLQRELERMAQGTKMPERLLELYAALGNDPFLVKECLARPALVDRLTHNFYAFDPAMHVKARGQAEALHRMLVSGELSPSADHPNRTVGELVVGEAGAVPTPTEQLSQRKLTPDEFQKKRAELPRLPGQVSEIRESREAFAFSVILNETTSSVRVASYLVPKTPFDAWWETARRTVSGDRVTPVATGLPELQGPHDGDPFDPLTACTDDRWERGVFDVSPTGRMWHTATWTGNQMVVWGGYGHNGYVNTGGRYDPATDTWTSTSIVGAPTARGRHTAVWTGSVVVVWGGEQFNYDLKTGGRYNPLTDTWTPTAKPGAPTQRLGHTAVWTGTQMVVWGGQFFDPYENDWRLLDTGAAYDPTADTWMPIATGGAPEARTNHTAIWTGSVMIIWGGAIDRYPYLLASGGRYDLATNLWTETNWIGTPSGRSNHTAVWTGSQMVVWGGLACQFDQQYRCINDPVNTGGRYDPETDTWLATSTAEAPFARSGHFAVWTGSQMVILGDRFGAFSGGRYNPASDTWVPTSTTGAAAATDGSSMAWTGSLVVVWGGHDGGPSSPYFLETGGRYDPVGDSWTPTSVVYPPGGAVIVWTGNEVLAWSSVFAGARYNPVTDSWRTMSTAGAPSMNSQYSGVWTGTLMVVWTAANDGGRYDPITDRWAPMSMTGRPSAVAIYASVWAGSRMVVWSGGIYPNYVVAGGQYDPVTDLWAPMSTTGAPSARERDIAVSTGNSMVVWGGVTYDYSGGSHRLNSGGRYDPAIDSWTQITTAAAPTARFGHTAAWTGSQLVVWGGDFYPYDSSGGKYDPVADNWVPTSTINAPSMRADHTAVWTGSLMVIWGGTGVSHAPPSTGGRYDPATDSWTRMSTTGAPPITRDHFAIWTGDAMMLWRGTSVGELYYPGTTIGDDCDNDGFSEATGDCNDHDAKVFPGAPQVCDGVNNNCSDPNWPVPPTNEEDHDGDGFGTCQGDCDDQNSSVYPGSPQFCDGVNNDCNDPSWPAVPANDADWDHDGFHVCDGDCDDTHSTVFPGAFEFCDGRDNNCDGAVDEGINGRCEDWNPCTDDLCRGLAGCANTPNTNPCDDGDACTVGDACHSGGCYAGEPAACTDNNPCTNDTCDSATGCVFSNNSSACDDGNACTIGDTCVGGACNGGAPLVCLDGNACNGAESCNPTSGCVAGTPLDCNDNNPCTDDSCDQDLGCVHVPAPYGTTCDDQNVCDGVELCDGYGTCVSSYPPQCDDHVLCTEDSCDPLLGCVYRPYPTSTTCSDGNACNGLENCDGAGLCASGTAPDCDDHNACTSDTCNPSTGCVSANNTSPCNDGNACTTGDVCGGGSCIPGAPRVCNDGDVCNGVESCNPTSGCIAGSPLTCNDNNPCTTDSCNAATGCIFTNNTNACNDGNACTRTDVCSAGACVGGNPVICAASDQCHVAGVCTPATGACTNPIVPNGTVCDDASLCTTGETCQSGTCTPAHSGLNHPRPRTSGYYRRICDRRGHDHHWYQGDQLTDADAVCVGQLTSTFAGISTVDEICDVIDSDRRPPHGGRHHGGPGDGPYGRDCDKGENELIATALNICRARVCEEQSLDSHCHGNTHTTVSQSFADADAILDDAARDHHTCRNATCELREINNGHALEMNSLLLSLENNKVRLTWSSPVLDDGSGSPSSYELWRRPMGSDDAFVKIGTTTGLTFLDVTGGTAAWEYDVTAVIPGD